MDMKEIENIIDESIEKLKDEIVKSTIELVRIKSVQQEQKDGMPFGEGVAKALEYCKELSSRLGFKASNYDGYAVDAVFGEKEEDVCVIGHLDVVPEGEGWTYPPYEGAVVDSKIYGRGSIDDKGPTIAALYGMYVVKELAKEGKISPKRSLRFVFGGNEESGSECMKHYFKCRKYPTLGFIPDADFPVINGEKGFLIFELKKKMNNIDFDISGGERPNMVPDKCVFKGYFDAQKIKMAVNKLGLNEKVEIYHNGIKTKGISAHGSLPFKGENAISHMFALLEIIYDKDDSFKQFVSFYNNYLGYDVYGKKLNIDFSDSKSGELVLNVGTVTTKENEIILSVNIRYPIDTELNEIIENIKRATTKYSIDLNIINHLPPLYIPEDHFLVKTLLEVYKNYTKKDDKPLVIGGGTYARHAKNMLAFGPNMPGDPELAHQKDEYMSIERLILCAKIYAQAILKLSCY